MNTSQSDRLDHRAQPVIEPVLQDDSWHLGNVLMRPRINWAYYARLSGAGLLTLWLLSTLPELGVRAIIDALVLALIAIPSLIVAGYLIYNGARGRIEP